MELMPRIMMDGLDPRLPDDVVICTPATIPSSALVGSEDCTLAISDDFTTVAEPVNDSLVDVPKATTMVSSSISASGSSATLIAGLPATSTSWVW